MILLLVCIKELYIKTTMTINDIKYCYLTCCYLIFNLLLTYLLNLTITCCCCYINNINNNYWFVIETCIQALYTKLKKLYTLSN